MHSGTGRDDVDRVFGKARPTSAVVRSVLGWGNPSQLFERTDAKIYESFAKPLDVRCWQDTVAKVSKGTPADFGQSAKRAKMADQCGLKRVAGITCEFRA
jgi:hypothetical protein